MTCRRHLIAAIGVGALALPLVIKAQAPAKVPTIGVVTFSAASDQVRQLTQVSRDRGYVEGKNIPIEQRFWEVRAERLDDLMASLAQVKPDVIVTATALPTRAAMRAFASIPIVFFTVGGDPVALGLVQSLGRPGGNVTGYTSMSSDLAGKQLQIAREVLPKLSRMAVLINAKNPNVNYWRELVAAARKLGLAIDRIDVRESADLAQAFAAVTGQAAGALLVQPDPLFNNERGRLIALADKMRVPTVFSSDLELEAGGFMSYGPSVAEQVVRAAIYVDKILKGAKPADLPVERPTELDLVINLKTAKALGIKVPQSVLLQATRVID